MSNYSPFSVKAAIELASPRSWVAAFGPALIAGALVVATSIQPDSLLAPLNFKSLALFLDMVACAILLQSAVNTLNDYQDYRSGLDSAQTILDTADASIVYNNINPKQALYFGIACMAAAGVVGLVVVWQTNYIVLLMGIFAALVVVLYSGGPKPISSLPLGEITSGLVMGGIITVATFYAMTLQINTLVFAVAVVPLVSIAQIMLTNNICDIERDKAAGRRTLPVLLGLQNSRILNSSLGIFTLVWMLLVLISQAWYWGLIIVIGTSFGIYRMLRTLRTSPYNTESRAQMMGTITVYNRYLVLIWSLAIILGGITNAPIFF